VGTVFFVSRSAVEESIATFGWFLPEFFFAYAEDLELSIRLKRNKKTVYISPKVLVTHLGSVTAKRGSAFQLYWGFRNLLFVLFLHWPWQSILMWLPWLAAGQLFVLALLVSKGHWLVYPRIWWSVWKNRDMLRFYRTLYYEKLAHPYTI
jgi:GT2 family glycosyltransferase